VVLAAWVGYGWQMATFDAEKYLYLADQYEVTIRRDTRGVPHILGTTNPDVAFGFAFAQAEDNWQLIEDSMPFYRGNSALYTGQDGAITDYLVKWLGLWETLEANYKWDISPDVRAYVEAYADGINYYAATHPDQVDERVLPVSGKDIVAGFMLRHLLFYGFEGSIKELTKPTRQRAVSEIIRPTVIETLLDRVEDAEPLFQPPAILQQAPNEISIGGVPIGSNAFAIAPKISAEGSTRLAINSHQPTTGPVAWYEAHLKSSQGLNVMGGLFPGTPMVSVGFTENLAWGATVNSPDLVDVFVLEINPNNTNQYRLDGQWQDLAVSEVALEIRLWGFFPWTVTQEVLASKHGPVLRTDHGTYAVRYAGMGELRQVEQWYRMNLATNLAEWREAMSMQAFASFNFVYADKEGNIMFLHNSLTPKRDPRYDWSLYLPGDDSSLIWKENLSFARLPQVINPASGYVHSANQTPFNVTAEADNVKIEKYAPGHGFQMDMTNRAVRGLELFQTLGPRISKEEFSAIKHDKFYSPNTDYVAYLGQIAEVEFTDSKRQQAQKILAAWDLGTDLANTSAAMGTCVFLAAQPKENRHEDGKPEISKILDNCIAGLDNAVGRMDPPWGEVNRHVRGDLNLPVAGGPDILRAIYGRGIDQDGYLTNVAGDGLYYLVEWDAAGALTVEGVHQFGSATLDETSPHYADQAEDYALEILHDPWFSEAALQQNLLRAYRPGDTP
jgi:penicillin amidase/acyl-homoserine-lactone acylase|tara:strand:+ start:14807 stop:16990 length:2184 start_codon:yes stop_codon:yes gene_type:complete